MDRRVSPDAVPVPPRRVRQIVLTAAVAVFITATVAVWLARGVPSPGDRSPATVPPTPKPPSPAAEADPRLATARQALESKDYVTALGLTEQAAKAGAPVAAVEALRAKVFRETDYLDREMECYERWAAAAPEDAQPWLALFYIYSDLSWKREADRASQEALKRSPQDARPHVARALFLQHYVGPEAGLREIDEAQRLNTGNAANLSNVRATLLLRAGRPKDAETEIRKAIAAEPSQVNHQMVLAQTLFQQDRLAEAAAQFRDVQNRDPDNVEAVFQLGVIAEKQGDIAGATRYMEQAAAMNAQHDTVLWNLAQLYRRQGRIEESKPLAKLYGDMKKTTGDFDGLIAQLDARPGDLNLHGKLAQSYMASGDYPKAIVELRAIQHFSPNEEHVLQALKLALSKSGRVTEANALKKAPESSTQAATVGSKSKK